MGVDRGAGLERGGRGVGRRFSGMAALVVRPYGLAWAGLGWAEGRGIAGAIAGATAGKAAAAAGSIYTAAVSKAAGDLTRALNAVQTGFVDAATAASLKATKAIAAAETVERKAVAKADVVLAQDLQSARGTYAAAECGAVILNARERATIGADYKKEVASAELAAVKAVAPARKTSMVAAAEANGVYHVKVTGVVADLGILGGEIHVEQVKASHSFVSPTTLKKWLDSLSSWGDIAAAFAKGLAQGVANLGNAAQDVGVGLLNVPAASVNFGSWASEKLFFDVPDHMKIRIPHIPSPDWSKGMVTQESDFDHGVSKGCLEVAIGVFGTGAIGRLNGLAVATHSGSACCASGVGGRIVPAEMVRTIGRGEKVSDLIREIAEATYSSGGIEHAIVVLKNGTRCIVKGGQNGIVFEDNVRRVLIHTHPTTTGASNLDFQMLTALGQRSSYIYELFGGGLTRFFRK